MSGEPHTLAILAFPDGTPVSLPSSSPRRVLAILDKVARYRRNPRSRDYMRALAAAAFPGGDLLEMDRDVPAARIASASHVVLLWPDAIGHGWSSIERAVFRARRAGTRVSALTGRRRRIELTGPTLLAFRIRRAAERLWFGEIAMTAALLLAAPVLVVWDLAKGRR